MKKPFSYQEEAIQKITDELKISNRVQVQMACGSGKTLTSLWASEQLEAKLILISVPKLNLQSQTLKVWVAEANEILQEAKILLVGSDKSIGKGYNNVTVSTDTTEIKSFLQEEGIKIVISTYQSSKSLQLASEGISFDLAIIDEAHRTAGFEEKVFNTILFDNNIKVKKRLFMSATPLMYSHERMISMDDVDVYGRCVYSLSMSDAIELGILTDYKILVIYVENEKTASIVKNKEDRLTPISIAMYKAIERFGLKKMITFHSSVKKALNFKNIINANYDITCLHVNHHFNSAKKGEIIESFKSEERAIITNPRIMAEGVDVPSVDSITLGDIKNSSVDIIQILGRALRKYKGKDLSYLLLPVFIQKDEENDIKIINENDLDKVRYALTSIASTDDRIAHEIGQRKEGVVPQKPIIEFGVIDNKGIDANSVVWNLKKQKEFEKLNENLMLRTWSLSKRKNWTSFEEAKKYAQKICKEEGVDSQSKWRKLSKEKGLRHDIPANPNAYYLSDGWNGWDDFFGVKREKKRLFSMINEYKEKLKVNVAGMTTTEIMEKYKVSRPTAWRGTKSGFIYPDYHKKNITK